MEQNENSESPADPPPSAPGTGTGTGTGLYSKDGAGIPPTHPDHGPMHLIPRQADGRISAYYYCSKAELYDAQIPAPPPRRQRRDGFTAERQELFLEEIRGGASGREAARRVGISPSTAYNLYNSPDGAAFRQAWDEAAKVVDIVLEDTAFDRAVNGQEEIVYHQGQRVGVRWKYDNKLLMQLLRARNPLKYAPLSEIEGWLKRRGIAPPPDVEGALDRLRAAEAEWGRRLPGEEAAPRIGNDGSAACRELSSSVRAEPVEAPHSSAGQGADGPSTGSGRTEEGGDSASDASKSSTSSGSGQAEESADQSRSSTSSGFGQAEESADQSKSSISSGTGQDGSEPPPAAAPGLPPPEDPSLVIHRPPPRPRT